MRNSRLLLCSLAALAFAGSCLGARRNRYRGDADVRSAGAMSKSSPSSMSAIRSASPARRFEEQSANRCARRADNFGAARRNAPGYNKVLATDEHVAHGAVRVRIPTVPDLEDHHVNVDVYVVGDQSSQSCDAGHMKIVRQRVAGAPDPVG